MTVTVDSKRRVVLPSVKPGELFQVELSGEGRLTLTRLAPIQDKPATVRFEKRNGYTVGVSERTVTQEAINEALADFP